MQNRGVKKNCLLLLILFFSFINSNLYAQLQASYWATEGQQLLDVSVHPPKIVGSNFQWQWWSTIADDNGNLLFYTDGSVFYDKFNKLIGKSGAEHAWENNIIIFPCPGKLNFYYVFFIGYENNDFAKQQNLYHCTVDLSNKINGVSPLKIVTKLAVGYNRATITRTSNCQSYWIAATSADSVKSFYVDRSGVNLIPSKSKLQGSNFVGQQTLRFSPDGNTLAMINLRDNKEDVLLEVFDFDKNKGFLSNRYSQLLKKVTTQDRQNWDFQIEFSQNNNNLFVLLDSVWNDSDPKIGARTNTELWIYKSKSKSIDEFSNTRLLLYLEKNAIGTFTGIQLTPSGRVYLGFSSGWGFSYLSSINKPDAQKKEDFDFEVNAYGPYVFAQPPTFPSYFFQNLNYPTTTIQANAGQDTLVCRGQDVKLGINPQTGYTYDWTSTGNLNQVDVSNPTLIGSKIPEPKYDTITSIVIVHDSVCRQGLDTVKVITKPAFSGKIAGSKSVCPGVKEVAYWVENLKNDMFIWDISGGVLAQNFLDSITVNWAATDFLAQVKSTAINVFGCPDFVDPFPVKIYKYLDTETPNGIDTLACGNNPYEYKIQPTNGSIYNWNTINGQVTLGNGTSDVTVAWDLSKKYGSLWINESVNTDLETCFGTSDTLQVVNPQAFGSENIFLYAISSDLDNEKIITLNYEIKNPKFFEPTSEVLWMPTSDQSWQQPFTVSTDSTSNQHQFDNTINEEYLFQITSTNICNRDVNSPINSNIFLSIKKDSINETLNLAWNKPAGWSHVDSYIIYRKKDDESFTKYDSVPGGILQEAITNTLDGFKFQYYVVGHSANSPYASFSNDVGASFEHIPFIPNVITPNGDHLNDCFVIEKINLYPQNYLTIYNRYGETVFEKVNYQNTWNGDNLSTGTYYYYFRTEKFSRSFKGWVQILR
jgi:gliding motility-associated-like protein